jgi:predicted TIM-barrel fold metal-dependent hydrolase
MVAGSGGAVEELTAHLDALRLVDHHAHGATRGELSAESFEASITESDRHRRPGQSSFDSQLGFALLRWCAPELDLEPHSRSSSYLARRRDLGAEEVTRRFLRAAGVSTFLVDTGFATAGLLTPDQMAAAAGGHAREIVRLEAVAEEVAAAGPDAAGYASAFEDRLAARLANGAVGTKSIVAYRSGLDVEPTRPVPSEVTAAAGRWLRAMETTGSPRLTDPVLVRHCLWAGVDAALPLQIHTGFGDTDLDLHRCNPALLTGFLRLAEPWGTPVVLLHCYPYHREAGYLAQMFPNVFFDVGEAVNYLGAQSAQVVAESLELGPFGKQLYSSDAWGPAELHFLGARLWRRAMASVLGRFVIDGDWSLAEAQRVASMVGADNATSLYGLVG